MVDAKTVVDRPAGRTGSSPAKVAECLVGDESGVIVFAAKNEQGKGHQLAVFAGHSCKKSLGASCAVDLAIPGHYIVLHNAKIDMFRGSMRLAVNQYGKVEPAESTEDFDVKVYASSSSTQCCSALTMLLYSCTSTL